MILLQATIQTDGASVAVDSKESYPETADNKDSKDSNNNNGANDELDPRIGLYKQQIYHYDSVGPIGGNQAFYLTSLPSSGNFHGFPQVQTIDVNRLLNCLLNGFNNFITVSSLT